MLRIIFLCIFMLSPALQYSFAQQDPATQAYIDSLKKQVEKNAIGVEKDIDSLVANALAGKDSFKYAKLLDIRGHTKRQLGNYAEALESHHKAYNIYNLTGNKAAGAGSLNSLGVVMLKTARYDEAQNYFMQALSQIGKDDSVMHKVLYSNLGVAYDYSGKTPLAIETYLKAARYVPPGDYNSISVTYHNIGVCYGILKNFKKAEEYELIALEYQKKTDNLDQLARVGISLGGLYLDMGQLDKAEHYMKMGGEAALKINSVEMEQRYYEFLIDLYAARNDTKKALEYYDKLNKLKARIYNEENSKNIAEAEARFKVSIKDKEIENLKINKTLADLKTERDRLVRNVLIVVIASGLIIIFVMFRNYKLRKKNFLLLEREKQLIEREKKALERNYEHLSNENILAKFEILKSQVSPHFMFNTLNALSFLISSDTDKAVRFTNAFSKLFRIVLELKDQNLITLQQQLNHVEAYFFLQHIRFSENLVVHQNIEPSCLDKKLPPFSIQIVVENAINHNIITENDPLNIKIYNSGDYLVIENNLQLKTNAIKSTSIGITNIKSRYSFFTDVEPEFIKSDDKFVVRLPLLSDL